MTSWAGIRRATAGLVVALFTAGPAQAAAPVTWSGPISGKSPFLTGCGVDMDSTTPSLGQGVEDAESEPTIAANPARPKNLIAAWMQDLYQGYVASTSRDGGRTWTTSRVPGNSTCSGGDMELAADPWLSVGGDGTAYLAGFSLDMPAPTIAVPVRTQLQVNVSHDGGRTWSSPKVIASGAALLHDKPAITADPHVPCTAHAVWMEAATAFGGYVGAVTSRTEDCGRSWSAPLPVPLRLGADSWAPEILALPDGDLLLMATTIPYGNELSGQGVDDPSGEPYTVAVVRSGDGGRTWSAPVTAAELAPVGPGGNPAAPFTDPETGEIIKTAPLIASADVGPDGSVYIAYRHGTGDRRSEIRVTRSRDGGRTWTAPAGASKGTAETFLPSIAVAGDGVVGVTYYDFRHDVAGDAAFTADVWFAHSRDGGRTWKERHLDGPVDFRSTPLRQLPSTGNFVGDYHGLAGLRDGFGAAYGVTRPRATAGATDIVFSRVRTKRGKPGKRP